MDTALTVAIWCVVAWFAWPVVAFILMVFFMLVCQIIELCTGEDIPERLKIKNRKQAEK
jgi:hypothetical protein